MNAQILYLSKRRFVLRLSSAFAIGIVAFGLTIIQAKDYIWDATASATWGNAKSWNLDRGFPSSINDNVTGNATVFNANFSPGQAVSINTLTPTTEGWSIVLNNTGSQLTINTLNSSVNFIIRGSLNSNATSVISIGTLNLSNGIFQTGNGATRIGALSINDTNIAGGTFNMAPVTAEARLGLVSFLGIAAKTINLVYSPNIVANHSQTVSITGLNTVAGATGVATICGGMARVRSANATTLEINTAESYGANVVLADGVNSTLSVRKIGTGSQILAGAGTYTAGTVVDEGTLLIANTSGSGVGTGPVTIGANAVFGGTGIASVGRNMINVAGTLQAGDGTEARGMLTINGNLNLLNRSVLSLMVNPTGGHSSLIRKGGAWVFDANQQVLLMGKLEDGVYNFSNLVTGLTGPLDVSGWTIANPTYEGVFNYHNGSIGVLLTVGGNRKDGHK